ncbi:MAG: hypothetical protein STSR0001_05700 [Methanothrix sp.]
MPPPAIAKQTPPLRILSIRNLWRAVKSGPGSPDNIYPGSLEAIGSSGRETVINGSINAECGPGP